jgi:hypothetical protein
MRGKSAPESAESGQQEEMRGKSTLDFTGGCPEVVCLEWSGVAWRGVGGLNLLKLHRLHQLHQLHNFISSSSICLAGDFFSLPGRSWRNKLVASYLLLAGYWLLGAGCCLLVVGCWLLIVGC